MEEMSKKTKRLEKENLNLTRKHDLTNRNIVEMAEERTKVLKEMELMRKKNGTLESVIRGMQNQGRQASGTGALEADTESDDEDDNDDEEDEEDEEEEEGSDEEGEEDEDTEEEYLMNSAPARARSTFTLGPHPGLPMPESPSQMNGMQALQYVNDSRFANVNGSERNGIKAGTPGHT